MIFLYLTRFTLPEDPGKRYAAVSDGARRLLRYGLSQQGLNPDEYPLCKTAEGKPYLSGSDLHLSISHSGPWAVIALSDAAVGVDLEAIRPVSAGVWKRFLASSPDEPLSDAREAILRWTRYEAALKRLGHPAPLREGVEFATLTVIPGYLLTVCGEGRVAPLRFVSQNRLI